MFVKLLLALILPALLVVLFTRVTYSLYVGTGLTLALIIGAVIKGYSDVWYIIVLDLLSLVVGFLYSRRMVRKFR